MKTRIWSTADSEQTLILQDGRKLGFAEYGDLNGFPIIGLHGTPGSRLWFIGNDETAVDLGVRLITVDRPGYGLSTPLSKRTLLDFNKDLDQLISHLGVSRCSIFGVSGGGAYALAYASHETAPIYKAGLVASIYEFENGKPPSDMCRPNRVAFYLARRFPWLLRYSYQQQKKLIDTNPQLYVSSVQKTLGHLAYSDQQLLKDESMVASMLLQFREAFRHSATEAAHELRMMSQPWGIPYEQIAVPVEIWHGSEDTLSPIRGMEKFHQILPDSNFHVVPGKGHFLDEEAVIWQDILATLKPI